VFEGKDYVPAITALTLQLPDGSKPIPAVAFVDQGARKTLCSQEFFETHLRTRGLESFEGTPVLVKGVDHTGEGVRTSRYVNLTWIFPNNWKVTVPAILVPHIPEPIILGRDWQQMAGMTTHQGETAESCHFEFGKGNLKAQFLAEEEYRAKTNPDAAKAAKGLQRKARERKVGFNKKKGADKRANDLF